MMPPKTAEIIVPLRFMLTVGTLIATLLVYFHRADNVAVSVASNPTTAELQAADASVLAAWAVQLVCLAISLTGLMGGFSMFMHGVGLLQIVCQLSAGVLTCLFILGSWHIAALWYITGFLGIVPAVAEAGIIATALACRTQRQ